KAVAAVTARRPKPAIGRRVQLDGAVFEFDRTAVNAIRPPETFDEWCDHVIAYCPHPPGSPAGDFLIVVLEEARRGPEAAKDAVRLARGLTEHDQWAAYAQLAGLHAPTGIPEAAQVKAAILAEWGRTRLRDKLPDAPRPSDPPAPRVTPERS